MKHLLNWSLFEGKHDVFMNKAGDEFWGDMGAGILPICKDTGRILVPYRSKHVNEPNTWGMWGGKMDDGETEPREAAKRELTEESGYSGHFELVPAYVFKTPTGSFEYHNFIGIVDKEFKPTFDWETEKARWMTLSELYRLKPKHWGLEKMIENSKDIIEQFAK